jgi:hypothetical protein
VNIFEIIEGVTNDNFIYSSQLQSFHIFSSFVILLVKFFISYCKTNNKLLRLLFGKVLKSVLDFEKGKKLRIDLAEQMKIVWQNFDKHFGKTKKLLHIFTFILVFRK